MKNTELEKIKDVKINGLMIRIIVQNIEGIFFSNLEKRKAEKKVI